MTNKNINAIKLKDILVPFQTSILIFEINDRNRNKNKNKNKNNNEICLRIDAIFHESMFLLKDNFNKENNKQQLLENKKGNLFEKWVVELVMRQIEANYSKTSINYDNDVASFKISRNYIKLKNRKFFGKMSAKPQYIGEDKQSNTTTTKITQSTLGATTKVVEKEIEYKQDSDNDNSLLREIPHYTNKIDLKKSKFKITIELPKENEISDIDLNVSHTQVTLKSQIYALKVPLPDNIKINPDIVKAKFDKEKHCLIVKLQLL